MAKRNFENGRNAAKVSDIINSSNMSGNAATAVDLDIKKIDENPDNESIFDMSGVDDLAKEIQEFGFTGAIDVYQKEDGRYELSSGHRRFRAVQSLGWNTIPAIIKPMPDELVRRHKLIHSNTKNRVLSFKDMSNAIKYERNTYVMELAKEKGVSYQIDKHGDYQADVEKGLVLEKLANAFNMSTRQIQRYIKLGDVIPEIMELVEKRRITMDCTSLFSDKTSDIQKLIYDAFITELSLGESDGENLSTLSRSQCNSIIKTILRENKEGISRDNEPPYTPYAGEKSVTLPTAIKFPVEGDKKMDLFESPVSQPQSINFSTIMNSGRDKEDKSVPVSSETTDTAIPKDNGQAKQHREYRNYIDNTIIMFTNQMSTLIQSDFDIQNKDKLSENIEKLESIIEKIKDKL